MDYFTQLVTMRRMEYESDILYKNKEIRGFCHLYIGQVRERFLFIINFLNFFKFRKTIPLLNKEIK